MLNEFATASDLISRGRFRAGWLRRVGAAFNDRSKRVPARSLRAVASGIEPLESRFLMASTFFVSTLGSDSAVGSLSAPFKTISKAAAVAQPGDVVNIRAGTYRETVTPARSGSSSSPIIYQAYNNEPVTVSGADRLTGFTSYGNGIYKASMPWTLGVGMDQVFYGGTMQFEARWPNTPLDSISRPVTSDFDSATYTTNTTTGFTTATISDASLTQPSGYWIGSTIHSAMGQSNAVVSGTVTGYTPGQLTIQFYVNSKQGYPKATDKYYLTGNKLVTLDTSGEWFRDAGGTLYARVPGDVDPDSGMLEVKRRQNTWDLTNKAYITVRNIKTFAGTIIMNNVTNHVVLDKIQAKYVSHFSNTLPKIYGGYQTGNDTSGIYLRGSYNTLSNSEIAFSAGNGMYLTGSNHTVYNNVIHDVAYAGSDCSAINTLYNTTPNVNHKITSNTIFNCGRQGIQISGMTNSLVSHNDIYAYGLQTGDGGGIYGWKSNGGGTVIACNTIHDGFNSVNAYPPAGIYLDEQSSNYVVRQNLIYSVGSALIVNGSSSNNQVYNNTAIGTQRGLVTLGGRTFTNVNFTNNIISGPVSTFPGAKFTSNLINSSSVVYQSVGTNNYQLAGNSAGINTGSIVGGVISLLGAPDIGAFEYGKSPWTSGALWKVTPGTPLNLTSRATSSSSVSLTWSAASGSPKFYNIYRSTDGTIFETVGKVAASSTTWTNTGLIASTKYFYRVRADESAFSNVSSTRTYYATNSIIQAEDYSASSGIATFTNSIGGLDAGDSIRFDNFDFRGGATKFTARISLPSGATGRKIQIRTGSPTGTLIGTLTITPTGGYDSPTTQSTTLTNTPTGITTVYLLFTGGNCGNADWWSFT